MSVSRNGTHERFLGREITRGATSDRVGSAILLLLVVSARASAQSGAAQNGDFDTDLSNWTIASQPGGSAQWSGADYAGSPLSGSALLVNAIPCVPTGPSGLSCPAPSISQCVSVSPAALYQVGFAALEPAGQTSTGGVSMVVAWNTGPVCNGLPLSTPGIGLGHISGWQTRSTGLFAPPTALSALIQIGAFRDETFLTGDYRVQVDRVAFGTLQAPAVPALDTFGLGVLGLALAAAGWFLLDRTRHS